MRPVLAVLAAAVVLGACGDDGGDEEAFCATARRLAVEQPLAVLGADASDPSATARRLRATAEQLAAWAEDAPNEVAGDVEALADAASRLAGAFAADDPPADDERAELEELSGDAEAASARVTAFVRDRCGVELDPAAGAGAATSTTAPSG